MAELLPALTQLAEILAAFTLFGFVVIRFGPTSGRYRRIVFGTGLVLAPSIMLLAGLSGRVTMAVVLTASMMGIMATTAAFLLVGRRRVEGSPVTHRRRIESDIAFYLIASVLWFTAMYWSGSSAEVEGLHFEVAPVGVGAGQPACANDARFVCNHLTVWEALSYSAGNLVTLGAPGIVPLDEFTRVLGLLQILPVFVAGYIYLRR